MFRLKSCVVAAVAAFSLLAGAQALAVPQAERVAIQERLKPAGTLCLKGEPCAAATAAASSGPRSGDAVYNAACMACHMTGAGGAPITGDKAVWKPRLAQSKATLYQHVINGLGAMPPRGTCTSCSDDELQAAVDHMVKASQ